MKLHSQATVTFIIVSYLILIPKLEPWEVCNRDLPHGAVVAYYRSPFPNVGAAAIAINNLEVLRDRDPQAFNKRGVAYMNPWTAKHIAITDFDGDRNGF